MRNRFLLFFASTIILLTNTTFAQPVNPSASDGEKSIVEVIYAIGAAAGATIVPDETVTGSISVSSDYLSFFEKAQDQAESGGDILLAKLNKFFSDRNIRIYIRMDNTVYFITMVRFEFANDSKTISMDADNVELKHVIGAIARGMKISFLYDSISLRKVSIHENNATIRALFSDLEMITDMTDSTLIRFREILSEWIDGANAAHVAFTDSVQLIDNMELGEFIWRMEGELHIRIIPDVTVNLDRRIAAELDSSDLVKSLDGVFEANHMFTTKDGDTWYISSVRFSEDQEPEEIADTGDQKLYSLDANDTEIGNVVERISRETQTMILCDPLPAKKITLSKTKTSLAEILKCIAAQLEGFKLEVLGSGFYLWDASHALYGLR